MDSPVEVLQAFLNVARPGSVFILQDFHLFLDDPSPHIIRLFKDALEHAKSHQKMMIIIGCRVVLPPEVEKLVTLVEFNLPTTEELAEVVLDPLAESTGVVLTPEARRSLAVAGGGLTSYEFQDALALSYVEAKNEHGKLEFSESVVYREKIQNVKKSGLVEHIESNLNPDDLGGLDVFKEAMGKVRKLFSQEAVNFRLPVPKGCLLVGPPGCGKSLSAKVSAVMLGGIPLFKCDMGKMFAGIVGASEANMRNMIDLVEAMSPCVLWLDEIERGLSGGESSGKTDGGTTDRMIGTLLNWLQEKTKPVYVIATSNDTSQLPAQLLRAGRFDQLWFADLPNEVERVEIWSIMIRRTEGDPAKYDLPMLAAETVGWSGSEIEALWNDARIDAFARSDDPASPEEPHTLEICNLSRFRTPLSKSQSGKIENMRKWAEAQARPATSPLKKSQAKSVRVLN